MTKSQIKRTIRTPDQLLVVELENTFHSGRCTMPERKFEGHNHRKEPVDSVLCGNNPPHQN